MSLDRSPSSPPPVSEQFPSPGDGTHTLTTFTPQAPPNASSITRIQIYSTKIPKEWITPICGGSAGVASGIVTCPLDVIKTKLQAQGGFQKRRNGKLVDSKVAYRGMVGTARTIWKEDGIRGMYRGLGPMLLGYLPTWAVYLTVYDMSREYYYVRTGQSR